MKKTSLLLLLIFSGKQTWAQSQETFKLKEIKRAQISSIKVTGDDAADLANSLSAPWVRQVASDIDAYSKIFQSSTGTLSINCQKIVSEKVRGKKIESNSCKITSIQTTP